MKYKIKYIVFRFEIQSKWSGLFFFFFKKNGSDFPPYFLDFKVPFAQVDKKMSKVSREPKRDIIGRVLTAPKRVRYSLYYN